MKREAIIHQPSAGPNPEDLVRTIRGILMNPTAWRELVERNGTREEFAEERARNVVAWLVAEFEVRRRT